MNIFYALPEFPPAEKIIIALGNFDGVHLGHQALISHTVDKAREVGGKSLILTFEPHPLKLIKPKQCPKLILTNRHKAGKIADLGTDMLLFLPFTKELASMSPEKFVEILHKRLSPLMLIVGFNYSYGYHGKGNPVSLQAMGSEFGFEVEILPAQKAQGELISSTNIRQALVEGNVERAKGFLGYWPMLGGKVVSGERRGRELGFPTANLDICEEILLPRKGVYAAKAIVGGKTYRAVVNIGNKPTFGEGKLSAVEVHLLEFQGDLYGLELYLHLLKYLRPEKRFNDSSKLTAQIESDIKLANQGWGLW